MPCWLLASATMSQLQVSDTLTNSTPLVLLRNGGEGVRVGQVRGGLSDGRSGDGGGQGGQEGKQWGNFSDGR